MEILEKLGVNWILLLGYFFNFLIIFFVLNKFVFKKALQNMEQRRLMATQLVQKTQSAESTLERAKEEFNTIVAQANKTAQEIVRKAGENADVIADGIKNKAQEQSDAILQKAQAEIAKSEKDLIQTLEKYVAELVIETVNQIISSFPADQQQKIKTNIDQKFIGNEKKSI